MCLKFRKERSWKGLWCVNKNPFHLWSIGFACSSCNAYFEYLSNALGSCDRASWAKCEDRRPTRCNNYMFIINFCFNMFRASLCPSSGEQRPCYCICCVFLVLLDVVVRGCGALSCRMWALVFTSYKINNSKFKRRVLHANINLNH